MNKDNILNTVIWFLLVVIIVLWINISWSNNETTNIIDEPVVEVSSIKIWSIWVAEFKEKIKEGYTVIDIRTVWEVNAWRLESMDLAFDYYQSTFRWELNKLDKNEKYLIYCRSGNRTGSALSLMKELWFKEVYDLSWWIGVWERAWEFVQK